MTTMAKWRIGSMGAGVALLLLLSPALGYAQQGQASRETRTIQVSAVGEATVDADEAVVHVGFQAYGADANAAYAEGSKLSNAIADALKTAGVAKDAIESESQSLTETQPFEQNNLPEAQRAGRRFHVQQSWTVKTAAKEASRVLDAAVKAGANQSGQIDWQMTDPDALQAKAMADAVVRARKNAELIANGMGVKLGMLLSATNQSIAQVRPEPLLKLEAPANALHRNAVQPLALDPQRIRDSATISATFAIE